MTSDQKKAYEWAKNQNYPSVAARYAKELAGLVDELQVASCARQEQERNAPLTLDDLRKMDGEPVWTVTTGVSSSGRWELCTCETVCACPLHKVLRCVTAYGEVTDYDLDTYGKTWLAYRQKPEEDDCEH